MTYRSKLRPYQEECLRRIPDKGSFLIQMATGTGKTVTFSQIPRQGRMLILSHREELVNQPVRYFDVPVGIEQGIKHSHGEQVISASVQSLKNRLKEFKPNDFDIIITDEAHHAAAKTYQGIYKYFKPRLHLGFTATPNRHDKVGLNKIFSRVIFEYPIKKAINDGYLCDINCILARVQIDFNSIRSRAGEFVQEDLESVMIRENNVEAIKEAYDEYAIGQTLIFACSVNHAKAIQKVIPDSKCVFGETPKEEREQIIQDFKEGKFRCLINCMILTEGTDIPNIESIIMAHPTKSETLYTQMVGRGLRLYPGKDKLNLIDLIGITQCHNLCTAPVLLGLDPEMIPESYRGNIQGDLLGLEEKINRYTDVFDNWIRSAQLVDIWANEVDLDTHDINFTRMPDGSLKVLDYTVPAPDPLGRVKNNYTMQYYIDRIYDLLMTKHQDKAMIWDLNLIRYWENEPATENQKSYANKLTRWRYEERIEQLNKFECSQLISRFKR